jgi:mRNA deadenylase 3'-5' endonuclease subunit Ccr4
MKPIHAADKQLLIVANAHMHWDPEYSDVKLIQTMMFVSEVKNILEKASSRPGSPTADPNSIPLVLCADLNSLPDSGIYHIFFPLAFSFTFSLDWKTIQLLQSSSKLRNIPVGI